MSTLIPADDDAYCMNRRRVLGTLGLGTFSLGGCMSLRTRYSKDQPTSHMTRTPATDAFRTITLASLETDQLTRLDVEPSVEVVESAVTDEHTARVELSLTNEGDRRRTLTYESCPPADEHTASRSDGDGNLVLIRSDEQDFTPASEECWRLSEMDFFLGEPCGPEELVVNAGETLRRTYELWDYPENERCMPLGEYRFGETYRIDGREHEWGFVVRVAEP